MKWNAVLVAAFGLVVLGGCATSNIERMQPGSITLDKMRTLEKPTAEWKNPDGTVTLEYSKRPSGVANMMLDFDDKGVLREARAAATLENMERIKTGMTRAEVQKIIGSPVQLSRSALTGGDVWGIPLETRNASSAQAQIEIYWHPTTNAVIRVEKGTYFE